MRVSRVLVCIASSSLLAAAGCGGGGAPAGAEPLGTSSSALSTTCPTVGPLGSPRHDAVAVTAPEDCLGGTSDSLGNIGLGWNHSPTQADFRVFTPGNAPLGTFAFGGKGVQPLGMHSGYEALDAYSAAR